MIIMQKRWQERKRPLQPEIAWAQQKYDECLIVDGSTLDALLKKVGLLRDTPETPLAGKMTGLLHLASQIPKQIWFETKATSHDQSFWQQILAALKPNTLLLFDLGYTNFACFQKLTQRGVTFITRANSNLKYKVVRSLVNTQTFRDSIIWIGEGAEHQQVRLAEVLYGINGFVT